MLTVDTAAEVSRRRGSVRKLLASTQDLPRTGLNRSGEPDGKIVRSTKRGVTGTKLPSKSLE